MKTRIGFRPNLSENDPMMGEPMNCPRGYTARRIPKNTDRFSNERRAVCMKGVCKIKWVKIGIMTV